MQLTLTKRTQEACKSALKKSNFPIKYKEEVETIANYELNDTTEKKFPISIDLLQEVSRCLGNIYFHELIQGSQVYIEPKEGKPKNPEFEAYMNKLRLEQQERDYNNMVSSVITSEDQKVNLGIKPDELKEVKSHVATIFNILFSMVAVYVAVYKASKTMVDDIGLQVLMGLGGAIMIGSVEGILYAKYAYVATSEKKKTLNGKKKVSKKIATL